MNLNDTLNLTKGLTLTGDAATSPLNTYTLQAFVNTIVSATARTAYVVVPEGGAGTVTQVTASLDAAPVTGALTLTPGVNAGGDPMTAELSFAIAAAAGTVDTAAPAGFADVVAGDTLRVTAGGTNTAAGTAMVTFTIQRS